jgi:hypothetical protein
MNGRERILAAFHGETPDQVPFAPNIYQWFYVNQQQGTLPEEVADARHPFDVLDVLDADILARWDAQRLTKKVYAAGEFHEEWTGESDWDQELVTAFNVFPPHRTQRHLTFETPHGVLTNTWKFSDLAGADYESKHWWTKWEEYDAVRFMMESLDYIFQPDKFAKMAGWVGDRGVMMADITESPLRRLFWLAGNQNATLFLLDHPEEMKALAQIHEEKALAYLETFVDNPSVDVFISHDNLDAMFYAPYFYDDYCRSFFERAADIIHSRGKILVVHACGRTRRLLPRVGASKIDCLEGVTPPPLGDVQLGEVRDLVGYENFTVNGGMDAHHQEIKEDAEQKLHEWTRNLFESMGDKRHFIFASSCNTSPLTPWENLKYFRDAAFEYGKI